MTGTLAAQAGKAQLAGGHFSANAPGSGAAQAFGGRQLRQVDDRVAAGADEMDVGHDVGVKPLDAIDCTDAGNDPLLFEQGQVSINRSQGDVGVGFLQQGLDHLGAGMRMRPAQAFQNGVALAKLLTGLFHLAPPI